MAKAPATTSSRPFRTQEKLLVYCEKSGRGPFSESGIATNDEIVFDLHRLEDLAAVGDDSRDERDLRSLITFEAAFERYGRPREGTWYELPIRGLGLTYAHDPPGEDPPVLKRGTLRAEKQIKSSDFRTTPRVLEARQSLLQRDYLRLISALPKPRRLEVVDCGQGNWNELRTKDQRVIYDCGGSWTWSKSEVRGFLNQRALASSPDDTLLIISHFDVDHYHTLIQATDAELQAISWVLAPDKVPDTVAARRFLERLAAAGVACRLIKPSKRWPSHGRKIMLHPHCAFGSIELLRATAGGSRNQTGIVLLAHGPRRTAILTGDHHHNKVLDALARCSTTHSNAVYVIPHHGGRAGPIDRGAWRQRFPKFDAAVSFGSHNTYGHPFDDVMTALRSITSRGIHRTATRGDFIQTL